MSKLNISEAIVVSEEAKALGPTRGAGHVVKLVDGVPVTLDGVDPVIAVHIGDDERDVPRLLRAAEELLPLHRQAPGVVILDEQDGIQGVIGRATLERAVLQVRRRDYAGLARGLGLRTDYRPPSGLMTRPFFGWACPECGHVYIPIEGRENDPSPLCPKHDPPIQMVRRTFGPVR